MFPCAATLNLSYSLKQTAHCTPIVQAHVYGYSALGAHAIYCMQRGAVTAHSAADDHQIVVELLCGLCEDSRQGVPPLCPPRREPATQRRCAMHGARQRNIRDGGRGLLMRMQ